MQQKQIVEKLETFKNSLNNGSENILTHLCDGLEKFLGYNKDSKGYDGTGIVYSDLDRLCDAVMGFLSGVLSAVKDDDAVKTYDNNVENINKIIKTLEKNLGNGPQKFTDAVNEVGSWLNNYFTQVEKYTNNVTGQLGELKDNIAGKYTNAVSGKEPSSLQEQLEGWRQTLYQIDRQIDKTITTNINKLDRTLRDNIKREITVVDSAVSMFNKSAWFEVFEGQLKQVDETLVKQRERVSSEIKKHCVTVMRTVDDRFQEIFNKLIALSDMRGGQFERIISMLQDAQTFLSHSDGKYKNEMLRKFKDIKTLIEQFTKETPMDQMAGILKQFETVKREVGGLEEKVRNGLNNLKLAIDKLNNNVDKEKADGEGLVGKQLLALANEMKKLTDITGSKTSSDTPEDNLEMKFKKVIQEPLKNLTDEVTNAITALATDFGKKNTIHDIFEDIKNRVGNIRGPSKTQTGLQQIANDVRTYTETFAKKHFGRVVQDWIDDILKKNKVVKHWFEGFFKDEANKNKFIPGYDAWEKDRENEGLTERIAAAIKTKIDSGIISEVNIESVKDGKVQSNLNAVKVGIESFIALLDVKLVDKEIIHSKKDSFVEGIVKEIESVVVKGSETAESKIHLFSAVKAIICALHSKAAQVAQQIQKLLDECKFKNVDSALTDVIKLYRNARDSVSTILGNGPAILVDNTIENVKKAVGDQLNDAFANRVKDNLQVAIHSLKETADKQIRDAADAAIKRALEEFHVESDSDRLDVQKIMTDFESSRAKLDVAVSQIDGHLSNLKQLPNSVDNLNGEAGKLIDEFKEEVQHKTQAILRAAVDTNLHMQNAIDFLLHNVDDAHKQIKQAAENLKNRLLDATESAFAIVTDQVQILFARQKRADLLAFQSLVSRQLRTVKRIILKDVSTGVKGFLKTLADGTTKDTKKKGRNIDLLKKLANDFMSQHYNPPHLKHLADAFYDFCQPLHNYLLEEITRANQHPSGAAHNYSSRLDAVYNAFDALLPHLREQNKYDCQVPSMLSNLRDAVTVLKPDGFSTPNTATLDCITRGLTKFADELDKAYVSVYDGETIDWKNGTVMKYCAKACLSLLSILDTNLNLLRTKCNAGWASQQIHKITEMGTFFTEQGYDVAEDGKQNGELQDKNTMTGKHIHGRLVSSIEHFTHIYDSDKYTKHALENVCEYLSHYYNVCHLIARPKPRTPCSIYEMLCWFSGLPCNPVYNDMLRDAVSEIFVDRDKQTTETGDDFEFTVDNPDALYLDAYPKRITYENVVNSLEHICSTAYDILCGILGTGDAYTTYSVDFCTNSLSLHYPSTGAECLDMLLDILRRLFPVLQFLHTQCGISAQHNGWSDCYYGRDIRSTNWPCDDHSSDKVKCQANCKANSEPHSQPMCRTTSPLQSYLNDCLPGHLPHQLTGIGCKPKCSTCPRGVPGMPCLTPLGFRGFSCSTRTGKNICDVLAKLFDEFYLPAIFCLAPSPPATLPEHFGFALSLVRYWHTSELHPLKTTFEATIKEVSMELYTEPSDLTSALREAYGSRQNYHGDAHPDYKSADLSSLSMTISCENQRCAPYISPLFNYPYVYFANKHCNLYLSWAVYLPWVLYNFLKNLLNAFTDINCQDWGCRGCIRGDICMKGKHGTSTSSCHCSSIVKCKGVSPTMYQHGFCFKDVTALNAVHTRRTCFSFQKQLKRILQSQYFQNLFSQCDNFLFKIRAPFIWLNVALWLLSLLYLLHIMVIRLDLLHIKSHLHSPSSHRIAAQSLLAAARVNKLNRVFYLQP